MVTPRPELLSDLQQDLVRLQALEEIRNAFAWLRSHEPQFAGWQLQAARIPAPPFGEQARGGWLEDRFREQGLEDVHRDDVGNVFGIHPAAGTNYVALSADIDTVVPAGTPLNIRQQGSRLYGPGVSDNGAGITAMLAIVALLQAVKIRHSSPLLFIGNVGE